MGDPNLDHDFIREPSWRWGLAQALDPADDCPGGTDDGWVARAARFLRRPEADPVIRTARELHGVDPPHARWLLEALLLTDEPPEGVARGCGLEAETVEAYHALFFDVRPHLLARAWVMLKAVGCGPWNGFAGAQPGGWWKYAAFAGGVRLLDVVLAVTNDTPFPAWLRASLGAAAADAEARLRLGCRLAMAVAAARSDEEVASLARLRERLRRLEGTAQGPSHDGGSLLEAMAESLLALGGEGPRAPRGQGRVAPGLKVGLRARQPLKGSKPPSPKASTEGNRR